MLPSWDQAYRIPSWDQRSLFWASLNRSLANTSVIFVSYEGLGNVSAHKPLKSLTPCWTGGQVVAGLNPVARTMNRSQLSGVEPFYLDAAAGSAATQHHFG
ncbi:MAG: hypothetical protein ACI9OJ_004371 [Myxococcota bacterium]|jgi:hypothetical protein